MRRFALLISLVALLALPGPALAQKNKSVHIMDATEVATGTPVTVTVNNPNQSTAYLVIKTANETATASMVTTVNYVLAGNVVAACTLTAITTNTTTTFLIGHWATTALGIQNVCQNFALPRVFQLVFTTSGAGADFDVTVDLEYVNPGA